MKSGKAETPARASPSLLLVPVVGPAASAGGGLRLSTSRTTVARRERVEQTVLAVDGLETVCGNLPAGAIRARNLDAGTVSALRCKKWGCDDCGPWLKRRLRRSIVRACEGRPGLRRFYTLTLPSEWHPTTTRGGARRPNPNWNGKTPKEAYSELSRAWAAFHKRVEARTGHRLSYGSVREPHADGTPHIHGLIDEYLPWPKLSQWWGEAGGGYAEIRLVETQRVAAYLSKYLSKDGNPPPKGCRKYATGGGVKFEGVRPPRPLPGRRLNPAAARSEWVIEGSADGRWIALFDPGPTIGGLQAAPTIVRKAWKVRPDPPTPVCSCGSPAKDCWSCGGPHCLACRSGSSTCWGNR